MRASAVPLPYGAGEWQTEPKPPAKQAEQAGQAVSKPKAKSKPKAEKPVVDESKEDAGSCAGCDDSRMPQHSQPFSTSYLSAPLSRVTSRLVALISTDEDGEGGKKAAKLKEGDAKEMFGCFQFLEDTEGDVQQSIPGVASHAALTIVQSLCMMHLKPKRLRRQSETRSRFCQGNRRGG